MKFLVRAIFLIAVLVLISLQSAYACSCTYRGKFTEYAKGSVVIEAEIKSYGTKLGHGKTLHKTMKVSITEVIKGTFSHTSIEFQGDPGHLCLSYVDSEKYPIGSKHLFAVLNEQKQGLGGCGEVSVSIVGGKVNGIEMVDGKWFQYSVDYDDFIKTVKKGMSNQVP